MPKITENLRNAGILADFSNLETAAQVDNFRHNYEDFVPQEWWDYQSEERFFDETDHKTTSRMIRQWKLTQDYLRYSWKNQFTDGVTGLIPLITSVFDPANLFVTCAERAVQELYPTGVPSDMTIELPPRKGFANFSELRSGYLPLQRAILYLFENPWRARFCSECNKRFVAAQPKSKFCGDECRMNNRMRQKLEWRREHTTPWRNRFCAECNKQFVAAAPKNKFCSEECRVTNRLRQKRNWFRNHGKQWRKKRRRVK
jgi:predicted nucleic acid-binding Zn ribbon protein